MLKSFGDTMRRRGILWLGTQYYVDEMRYRQQARLTRVMLGLTVAVFVLTGIVTAATMHNVFRG